MRVVRSFALAALAALAACSPGGGGPAGGGPGADGGATHCGPPGSTQDVFSRLAPTCAPCHGAGTSKPYFADRTSFESLLAYDAALVTRGDPDASVLIQLLEGRGTGTYRQMPLAGSDFATLARMGQTQITLAEVRDWVRDLPPPPAGMDGPDLAAATTRRLTADEFVRAVQIALGQEPGGGVPPLLAADVTAPLSPDSPAAVDYNDGLRVQMYLMLGGPGYLAQRPAERAWSNSSLIAVAQIAQGACAAAVRARSPRLFRDARPDARLATDAAAIRANIASLYRRWLHAAPTDAEIEAYVTAVYAPAERTSPDAAWTQVCTALMRDPLFLTY